MKQLGTILLEDGVLSEDQLMDAIDEQQRSGQSLGRTLVELGLITESQLVRALASQVGMEFVELANFPVDVAAVALVPAAVCRRHNALPIALEDGIIKIAMANPGNVVAVDDFQTITGRDVIPVVATHDDVIAAIDRFCRADSELENLQGALEETAEVDLCEHRWRHRGRRPDRALRQPPHHPGDPGPCVRHPHRAGARTTSASGTASTACSTRCSGHRRTSRTASSRASRSCPTSTSPSVASRRTAALSVTHEGRKIDLRVATLPTVWGEKVVMRILDNTTATLDLADLGILDAQPRDLRELLHEAVRHDPRHGSDRLGQVDDALRHAQPGLEARDQRHHGRGPGRVPHPQHQPGPGEPEGRADLRRARCARSCDPTPTSSSLGEIRDHETAQIAIEAALTGHLVLSTLHTNDAPSAITRLIEMDIEPFLVGSAVDSVVAQRLARRLCEKCKQEYLPEPRDLETRFSWHAGMELPTLFHAGGVQFVLEHRVPRSHGAPRDHAGHGGDRADRRRSSLVSGDRTRGEEPRNGEPP